MYKMEYEENPAMVSRAASKKMNYHDSGTKSLKQVTNSLMLKNVSESQGDITNNLVTDVDKDNERQDTIHRQEEASNIKLVETKEILDDTIRFIDKEVKTELKLDEMMEKLMEYLDETIDILKVVDIASTDNLPLNDEDDDSGYHYIVTGCDRKYVHETENLNDDNTTTTTTIKKSRRNENSSEIDAETKSFGVTNKLNEFKNSFIVVFMLFSLYLLISFLV